MLNINMDGRATKSPNLDTRTVAQRQTPTAPEVRNPMDRVVAVAMRLAAAKVTGLAVGGATVLVVRTRMVRAGGKTQQTAGRRLSELKKSTPRKPVGSSSHRLLILASWWQSEACWYAWKGSDHTDP